MGTRGLYAWKWREKYYVYYNNYDSYPSGLGKSLVTGIPSDPERYRMWLQRMRSQYSDIAKVHDKILTVSMDKFGEGADHEDNSDEDADNSDEDADDMPDFEKNPDWMPPENDLWIEWFYVIDLDREIFEVNGACFYHLSKIPPEFEDLMEEAQKYWLGNVGHSDVHESITTNDVHSIPLTDNPTPAFLQMKPITVCPKHESRLNRMPAFVACKRLYELFLTEHEKGIRQAQDTHIESDFLFRELVFALMCFASCSPAWVRLISTANMMVQTDRKVSGEKACGVILDDGAPRKPKEFVARFLQGYHLEGMESGSAPKSTSYWFSGALVYLKRDIASDERLRDAIVSAVTEGKADGRTHFNAIIISLKHFVLLKFVDGTVQHTERLNLGAYTGRKALLKFWREEEPNEEQPEEEEEPDEEKEDEASGNREESVEQEELDRKEESGNEEKLGKEEKSSDREEEEKSCSGEKKECEGSGKNNLVAFEILAHFFDAVQKQGLKPSIVHNEGVFPNEIYRKIISYVDRETNIACLQVSRPFREFASETFIIDNRLKLIYCPGKEPECFDEKAGFVGLFKPVFAHTIRGNVYRDRKVFYGWYPIFGAPDGSASMESSITFQGWNTFHHS
ncbi:hypothetical protein F4679DRAFT_23113 [Xylaria curta]|nr:hypothetical protein F4679DRAFT_23113 [Xylaria curta]